MGDPKTWTSSAQVRDHLVRALKADLVGPFGAEQDVEVWDMAPSTRYLCGFLVPQEQAAVDGAERDDPSGDDALGLGDDPPEGAPPDPEAKPRRNFRAAELARSGGP